jgi:hypothetical protein
LRGLLSFVPDPEVREGDVVITEKEDAVRCRGDDGISGELPDAGDVDD